MRNFHRILGLFITISLIYQCKSLPAHKGADKDLQQLVKFMVGDFSSQAQSKRDSDFYDIRLHIRPIWTSDKANHWLYVEQATAAAESKPYRAV